MNVSLSSRHSAHASDENSSGPSCHAFGAPRGFEAYRPTTRDVTCKKCIKLLADAAQKEADHLDRAAPAPKPQPQPVIKARLTGESRPAFEQPVAPVSDGFDAHPYDGKETHWFGQLGWACERPGHVWFFQNAADSPRHTLTVDTAPGKQDRPGWYLTGPGVAHEGAYMGRTLAAAALMAQDAILAHKALRDRVEGAKRDWPEGTRVQGVDSYNVTCMGTVNGAGWGSVTDTDHANYGRTWVGVTWDEMPHNRAAGRHNRPFTDSLIRH